MKETKQSLNLKQEKAIMALLTEPTIKLAADKAGVGETTLYRWIQEEEFDQAFKNARKQAFSQTISRLQQTTTKAVATLESIMDDEGASASSRVTASKTVLEMAFKGFELEDLAEQVKEMQQYIQEVKAESGSVA